MAVLSWMAIFHLVFNENDFSVPLERHTLMKSHDTKPYASSFHWNHKYHYEKLEHVIVMITWSWNADTGRRNTSGLNHIMQHQLQIMLLIRFFDMLMLHGMPPWYSQTHLKEIYGSYLYKKF